MKERTIERQTNIFVDTKYLCPALRGLGRDLEQCGKLPANPIMQDEQQSTKLKSVVLWNTPGHVCLGRVPHQLLNQLDSIQQKALRIIGVDRVTACRELANSQTQKRGCGSHSALQNAHQSQFHRPPGCVTKFEQFS